MGTIPTDKKRVTTGQTLRRRSGGQASRVVRSGSSASHPRKPRSRKKKTGRFAFFKRWPSWAVLTGAVLIAAVYVLAFNYFFVRPYSFRWKAMYSDPVYPAGFDIHGIDVSHYQADIDWERVRNASLDSKPIRFVFIKATEGTSIIDENFNQNFYEARQNDILRGAYHFFTPDVDAAAQARFFLRQVHLEPGDLPPVLDLEPSDREIERAGGAVKMFREVLIWMKIVEKRVGVRPILYVNQMFVNKYLPLSPELRDNYNVWIARYGSYKPDIKLVHWQLSADGKVNGIVPEVDINVFNGYKDEFMKYLHESTIKSNVKP